MISIIIYIQYFLNFLIFYPIAVLIHELGHAFFVKLFGGKVISVGFGTGEKIFQFKKFYIGKNSILFGRITWETSKGLRLYQSFLLYFGGILFNIVTGTFFWIFGDVDFAYTYRGLVIYSYLIALFSLIPVTYKDGIESDGLKILTIFKNI